MTNGISLHIGLNRVDPNHYDGWEGSLTACEADALDMESITRSCGFLERTVLLTADATIANVVSSLKKAAELAAPGDLFVLSYSGHGGQVRDFNGDEPDMADETMCLYDRQFVDDHLYTLLGNFKAGVRILELFDCCHSGTMTRMQRMGNLPEAHLHAGYRVMPPNIAKQVYYKNRALYESTAIRENPETIMKKLTASVLQISACQDNQLASDGTFNGLFTGKLLSVWKNGNFFGDYHSFYRAILHNMPAEQTPNYFTVGSTNPAFEEQRPFTIQEENVEQSTG